MTLNLLLILPQYRVPCVLVCVCVCVRERERERERERCEDEEEIEDRFYTELEFGTAGLRGVIGAGTNRMNIYTVRKATQGLANYIEENKVFVTVALAVLWKEASGNWRAVPLVTKRMLGSGYFCLHPACSHLHIFHLQYSAESALTRSSRILSSCCKIQWPV